MIVFTFDDRDAYKVVSRALGDLEEQTPNVLKNALNSTARKARNLLDNQAKKTYTIEKAGFSKEMKLKSATKNRLSAVLTTKGPVTDLIHFKVSPKPSVGGAVPEIIRVQVKKDGGYKDLVVNARKAFFVKFRSGHLAIAQRKGTNRLPIKTLYSLSIPKMIGNEKSVLGVVDPQISEMLDQEIRAQIEKTIKKAARTAA
jgi:hypothetical protein